MFYNYVTAVVCAYFVYILISFQISSTLPWNSCVLSAC